MDQSSHWGDKRQKTNAVPTDTFWVLAACNSQKASCKTFIVIGAIQDRIQMAILSDADDSDSDSEGQILLGLNYKGLQTKTHCVMLALHSQKQSIDTFS
jgi:hypothetical protein